MPSQRPYFLSSFLSAFRQQPPSIPSTATNQPSKHQSHHTSSASHAQHNNSSPHTSSTSPTRAATAAAAVSSAASSNTASSPPTSRNYSTSPTHTANIPIPTARRGSNSSTEGFREVNSSEKWYIGGRTAGGEERFFKLGVVRRVRSNDGLSLDRLSL